MVLLTSSQVSVVISSFVVFLFTSALFLSGYALQQQTVRDLRAAIKPQPAPPEARMYLPKQFAESPVAKPSPKENGFVVEVKNSGNDRLLEEDRVEGQKGKKNKHQSEEIVAVEGKEQKDMMAEDRDSNLYDLPSNPELYDIPSNQDSAPDTEVSNDEKSMSRAERRKRIKEEIMAGSEEAGFKGYRRRMW